MHEMSNSCVPYGPIDGSVSSGSTFIVYFSDPFEPNWCYGYSWQLARKGYVLCGALGYVDGNPDAVWRLVGDRLVPAPPTSGPKPYESCGFITYFHCEHTLVKSGCTPTTFWKNYNPNTDHFSDPSGASLNPPEQVSIRDEPYRRYGPRGLRAYHDGVYGFYSVNCVSP